ncbi:MAG: hypothetical protein ACK4VN_15735 [Bacteroidales bacterium]
MTEQYSTIIEWIGYLGSILVAVSLMMSSILKLRWLNLIGAAIFSAYGFIIGAMPVAFLNLFIVMINIYHLGKIYKTKDFLKILHIRKENRYLEFFLEYYHGEINQFFPGFYDSFKNHLYDDKDLFCFLIIRNAAVAGIFIGRKINGDEMFVEIDFVIPEYRDFKTGNYIYTHNQKYFENLGIRRLSTKPKSKKHYDYLKKMGFEEQIQPDNNIFLVKDIH